jgi:hypothetical protein
MNKLRFRLVVINVWGARPASVYFLGSGIRLQSAASQDSSPRFYRVAIFANITRWQAVEHSSPAIDRFDV